MKLLHRLRQLVEPGTDGSVLGRPAGDRLDTYQTDETSSTLTPVFLREDWDALTQAGRRHIPDIHEDIPPSGLSVFEDDSGLDAA